MSERLQIVVDVDGAGKGAAEIRKVNREIAATGKAGRSASTGVAAYGSSMTRVERESRRANAMSTRVASGMKAVGTAAAVTGGLILTEFVRRGLTHAISEGREAERTARMTANAIRSTGGEAKVSAEHVSKLAESLSEKVGVDDEVIQSGENLLLTFTKVRNEVGKGNNIFDQATIAALDMSAAMKAAGKEMSIADANMAIGKALNDPARGATALRKAGVDAAVIDEAKALAESGKRLQAQKVILAELRKEFGGAAEASADPFQKLKVSINNLFESLGRKLLPTLGSVASSLTRFISSARTGSGAFVQVKRTIDGFIDSLGISGKDVRQFGAAISNVWKGISGITKIVWPGIKQAISGNLKSIGGVVKVFTGILTLDFGKAWEGVKQIFSGGVQNAKGILKAATSPFRAAAKAAFGAIKDPISDVWREIRATVAGFVNGVIDIINKIPGVNIGKINLSNAGDTKNRKTKYRAKGGYVNLAGGGLMQIGRAGDKGYDNIPMNLGGQNVMVGSGEVAAVFNRHQQAALNARLADQGGLSGFFQKNKKPHYMALGGVVPNLPKPLSGPIVGDLSKWVLKQAKSYIKKATSSIFGGGDGKVPKGVSGSLAGAMALARQHGLAITSTTGGKHAPNSWHYRGRAFDAAGAPGGMASYFNAALRRYGRNLIELFYDPLGAIKNGKRIGAIGGHSDHVHTALAKGGFIRGKVSVFGPPLEGAGTTAYGRSSSEPGIAVNPDGGRNTWNNANALSWKNKLATVTIGGKSAKLRVIDKGPSIPGRLIDVTGAGARKMGINPSNFPTDSIGTASWGSSSGKEKRKTKAIAKNIIRGLSLSGGEAVRMSEINRMIVQSEGTDTIEDDKFWIGQRIKLNSVIRDRLMRLLARKNLSPARKQKWNDSLAQVLGAINSDNDALKSLTGTGANTNDSAAQLAREIRDLLKRTTDISASHRKVFDTFANNYVGSFAQGGPINQTGMALVHRGEHVVPRSGALVTNSAPPNIVINLSGQNVEGEVQVDGRTVQKIDRQIGRSSRRIRVAPGRA